MSSAWQHASGECVDDDDFAIDIDNDGDSKDYTPIIEALRDEDTKDEAVTTLIDACETAIELDNGLKNEEAEAQGQLFADPDQQRQWRRDIEAMNHRLDELDDEETREIDTLSLIHI